MTLCYLCCAAPCCDAPAVLPGSLLCCPRCHAPAVLLLHGWPCCAAPAGLPLLWTIAPCASSGIPQCYIVLFGCVNQICARVAWARYAVDTTPMHFCPCSSAPAVLPLLCYPCCAVIAALPLLRGNLLCYCYHAAPAVLPGAVWLFQLTCTACSVSWVHSHLRYTP